jgi:dTDP-4-amino-4,6-dideoxygalactose transaminase
VSGVFWVLVDVGEDLNIDADLIEEAITPRTKAIVPVHFTGQLCDIDRIADIADGHGVAVVEDAAQAFGARYDGRMAGSFGLVSAFSMNPMKVFNAYGEAGAVVTDNETLYEKLVSLRYAGTVGKEDCVYPSINGRIDTLQAAMLLVSLRYLADKISRRRKVASLYSEALGEVVGRPREKDGYFDVYYTYTIVADERDQLARHLMSKGIETKIQHPILMPYHTAYRHLTKPNIPVAEQLVRRILSIPSHEDMTPGEVEQVAACIRDFYGE